MDHIGIGLLGAHLQQHAEPISFGIDQILSNVEQSCMLGARMHEPDYGAYESCASSGVNGAGYVYGNTGYNSTSSSCGMASLGGAYHMNMGVNAHGTNGSSSRVIRVPAHRPVGGGNSSVPPGSGCGNVNNMTALTKEEFWLDVLQAADGGGAGGGEAAGQPDPHAATAGGLPEDHQPAGHPGPAVPAEQLPVRPAEHAAMDREHRQDLQRVGLRVEPMDSHSSSSWGPAPVP
ncbi:hypothetical protein FQN60_010618, partial [Etheostoma spectabile]